MLIKNASEVFALCCYYVATGWDEKIWKAYQMDILGMAYRISTSDYVIMTKDGIKIRDSVKITDKIDGKK